MKKSIKFTARRLLNLKLLVAPALSLAALRLRELVHALLDAKDDALGALGMAYEPFFEEDDEVHSLQFPVHHYPDKVTSTKLEKVPVISGKLVGVKGQYWMWEDGRVWNVRAHAGSRVEIDVS